MTPHSLAGIYFWADASPQSLVFSLLKGTPAWASDLFDPPQEPKQSSVISSDVLTSLEPQVKKIAAWFQRAGVPANVKDTGGNTPLHFAAYGGSIELAKVLLEMGADVNAVNNEGRTPIHFALAQGQSEMGGFLFQHHADMEVIDKNKVKPIDLVVNPGPIMPADALKYFNMEQRKAKQIERIIHPELHPDLPGTGWVGGAGGWNTHRLKGFEDNMDCSVIDQYWAHEITADEVFHKYIARNTPIMIRGLLEDWPVIKEYERETLLKNHGDLEVTVSDIPYSQKFGGVGSVSMTLSEYAETVKEHTIVGGSHPWYVFKGNPVSEIDKDPNSLVALKNCPTPEVIQKTFDKTVRENFPESVGTRDVFVNAQWAMGGEGTGAPVHFHNTAWNAMIYGAKYWTLYPPKDKIMSHDQILQFTEENMQSFCARGKCPVTCVQTAGDVVIVPESWGHGVLNIQESVAVATEVKVPNFRFSPSMKSARIVTDKLNPSGGRGGRGGRGGGPGGRGAGRGGSGRPGGGGDGAHLGGSGHPGSGRGGRGGGAPPGGDGQQQQAHMGGGRGRQQQPQ